MKVIAIEPSSRSSRKCAYCKGAHESSDHSPPKCLLIWPPAADVKVLTIPSCFKCNQATSRLENLVWIMLSLVGRHPVLTSYLAPSGKVDRAFAQDPSLEVAIAGCRNSEGNFTLSGEVSVAFDRIVRKVAQGLYFGLYGRVPGIEKFELLSIEHSQFQRPDEVVARLRKPAFRDITDKPLPALTQSGLTNVYVVQGVMTNLATGESHTVSENVFHDVKQEDVEWITYQPETLSFTFFQDEAGDAVCVMDFWGTLIAAVKAPWPSQRGSLRRGRKNPNARS